MDLETAKYIVENFSGLLTGREQLAIHHTMSSLKLQHSNANNFNATMIYREKGWINKDQDVLDLIKDGYDAFEIRVASRISMEYGDKVFLNNCPKCNRLARTPQARQCRHCGYNWH